MTVETIDRVPIHFRCTRDTVDAVDEAARRLGVSRSMYVRNLILRDLGMSPEPHRMQRRDDVR